MSPLRAALAAMAAALVLPASASAARPTGAEPNHLTTAHFRVHYAAGVTAAYAQAGANDFEESYSRLVFGAGGTPNAGLRPPVSDAGVSDPHNPDGLIDVYVYDFPEGGGIVRSDFCDPDGHGSAYVLMDAELSRDGFRFRAGHELFHVLQRAYTCSWGMFLESQPNWAAEWALPDVDPLDNQFAAPFVPLECGFGTWAGTQCHGYGRWPFVQLMVERYGPDFVEDWLLALETLNPGYVMVSKEAERQILRDVIAAQSGGTASLSTAYADYAARVWDPTVWHTTALGEMLAGDYGSWPLHTPVDLDRGAPDSGTRTEHVDHLAARYVRVRSWGAAPTGPGDQFRITVSDPGTGRPPAVLVQDVAGLGRTVAATSPCGGANRCVTVPADPAKVSDVVLALVNDTDPAGADTSGADGRPYGWRVELLPGPATPPANDTRAGAQAVTLGAEAGTVTAYAGGRGEQEVPPLATPYADGAVRGVWFRFTAPGTGVYRFDTTNTDFRAVVVAAEGAGHHFAGYAPTRETGFAANARLLRGESVDVYVGRHPTSLSRGVTARLLVTGPGAPPASPPATTPPPVPPPQQIGPVDRVAPRARVLTRTVRVSRRGELRIRLGCPAGESSCRARLSIPTTRRIAFPVKLVRIAGGRTATVTLRLSRRDVRTLKRIRRVRVRARVVMSDAAGNTRTVFAQLTVLAPK